MVTRSEGGTSASGGPLNSARAAVSNSKARAVSPLESALRPAATRPAKRIELVGPHNDQVTRRPRHQDAAVRVADQSPQPMHVGSDQVCGFRGRLVTPQLVYQPLRR